MTNPVKSVSECLQRVADDGDVGDNWTIRRAKLQSDRHHQQTNTQIFTGRMPFLLPNQCRQSTEGKKNRHGQGISWSVLAAENNTRVGLARSMASAGAQAYNGGPGARAPGGGRGQSSPEADGILVLEHTFVALSRRLFTLL